MSDRANTSTDMVEVTDSLEAIAVFRGWKNVFLTILIVCLLVLQGAFWLVDLGIVVGEDAGPADPVSSLPVETAVVDANAAPATDGVATVAEPNAATTRSALDFLKLDLKTFDMAFLIKTMKIANGFMLLSGILFCVTLLFSMTITIIGRLGGIRHVCRAFFMSLIMLVLILPWHQIFDSLTVGFLYQPEMMVRACQEKSSELLPLILHYLRYCGYWLLVCAFLMAAQARCRRWARSIRRRLQII